MTHSKGNEMVTGYLHPNYAESFAEFGTPRQLPQSQGWILERKIPGFSYRDAMGCYPLFNCLDWSQIPADLDSMQDELVSLALVTDPFGEYDLAWLHQCFKDVVIPFKEHFIIDLQHPLNKLGGKSRRKHARRALRKVEVEVCEDPLKHLAEWSGLYAHLIERHNIRGMRAFSKKAFSMQLNIPQTVMLRAIYEGTTVGAQLYYLQGDVVHCHLGANSEMGYEVGATYALDWFSFEYFADKARWLDIGGGAGVSNNGTDGLSQYKRGWSTETQTTYFLWPDF